MKNRVNRLKTIESLINKHPVANQEQLLNLLKSEGHDVTQATLSRDLRHLQVWRTVDETGSFRYCLQSNLTASFLDNTAAADIQRGCLSVNFSGNLVVMHTSSGFSGTLSNAINQLLFDAILLALPTEHAVLVILAEGVEHQYFMNTLRQRVPSLSI